MVKWKLLILFLHSCNYQKLELFYPYSIATQTGVAVTHFSQLGVEVIISTPNATDHLRPRELESDEAKEKKRTDLKCCFEEELGA